MMLASLLPSSYAPLTQPLKPSLLFCVWLQAQAKREAEPESSVWAKRKAEEEALIAEANDKIWAEKRAAEKAAMEAAAAAKAKADQEKAKPMKRRVSTEGGGQVSQAGLMKLTVRDLRERCKEAGVATTGKKADLVDRLLQSLVAA